MNCYKYDNIKFKEGILDNIIDAVYVLLLEGSNRTENVYKQIKKYKLCKNNYIQINKGYKKCKKNLIEQSSKYDIQHSNYRCCIHASKFNNVLILEDDFILDKKILDKNIINDLEIFLKNNEFNVYSLGNLWGHVVNILNFKHPILRIVNGSHSMIWSKKCRDGYVKDVSNKIYLYKDQYLTMLDKKYTYYKQLCYQTYTETENYKSWRNLITDVLYPTLELDQKPKNGFYLLNICSNLLHSQINISYIFLKKDNLKEVIIFIITFLVLGIAIYCNKY